MARPLRIELTGGLYHVSPCGDRGEAIYRDLQERADWLAVLGEVCGRFDWRCHAYCEMTNSAQRPASRISRSFSRAAIAPS